jgi:pantoate--beta-alanine ligase
MFLDGSSPSECLNASNTLLNNTPQQFQLDYLVITDEKTLIKIEDDTFKGRALVLVAALVGQTRLIDNLFVEFK